MPPKVKICGITEEKSLNICIKEGADFIGFVFFERSPRNISIDEAAKLVELIPDNINSVALSVDATKQKMAAIIENVKPDYVQLHGQETPEFIKWIKDNFDVKIIKVIAIREEKDLEQIGIFEDICDWLLFDAKTSKDELPGGNGLSFDWKILQGVDVKIPWMLAGGLTPDNVAFAVQMTLADGVDVSSGVEGVIGEKDEVKIVNFIKEIK